MPEDENKSHHAPCINTCVYVTRAILLHLCCIVLFHVSYIITEIGKMWKIKHKSRKMFPLEEQIPLWWRRVHQITMWKLWFYEGVSAISRYTLHVIKTSYVKDHPKIVHTISYLENKRQVMSTDPAQTA